ncbi:MAG TPA: N-formylglutamate amidohydrolase [Caulobacteraceae bacterium]|nr:N-formylglutamate amidohydrolase [Caulobacteraceae bacterium]
MLVAGERFPVVVENPGGSSPFLLIGDHAGRAVPRALGGLGLAPAEMDGHIAWDIGVAGLGGRLARALDACFIAQAYSRLVIDCNRRPDAPDLIPEISDGTVIPGNIALGEADIAVRVDEIARPYQAAIAAELDRRTAGGRACALVSLHSFTPAMRGQVRPWRIGVLHRGDSRLSSRMLALLQDELGTEAGDNQPYRMDTTDYTVPLHVDPRGLDYLELEVRQDLIGDPAGQAWAAALIGRLLPQALGPV